jgi:IclR family transcriptional regulator, acetate operon repressor
VDAQLCERREQRRLRVALLDRHSAIVSAAPTRVNGLVPLIGTAYTGRVAGASSAERIVALLEACATSVQPLALSELARCSGLPKTSAHRLCGQLCTLGLLERGVGGYALGGRLFAMAGNPAIHALRACAIPVLHELAMASGYNANLAVLSGSQALLVEEVYDAAWSTQMIGRTLPLHCTAVGKALLLGRSARQVEQLLGTGPLEPYTRHSIVRLELLIAQLAAAQHDGVTYSNEEWQLGIAAVAAPVSDARRAGVAISLAGPPGERALRRLAEPLRRAADALAAALREAA